MKILKYTIPILAGLFVAGLVWATFPTALNNWQYGDVITEDWANSLESTVGITNSTVVTSHDYLIGQRLTIAYASSTYYLQREATTTMDYWETKQTARIADDLTDNSISDLSDVAAMTESSGDLLYTNGSSQWTNLATSTKGYVLAIGTNGYPAWISTTTWDTNTTYTADNPVTLNGTVFGINNTSSTNQMNAFSWGNHASSNYLTQAFATTTYLTKSKYYSTTTWAGGDGATVTGMFLYPAFTYTTSSWSGTTTIALGTAFVPETWSSVQCFTTAGSISLRFGDGTNKMNWVVASTTVGQTTLSINNIFTAQETRYVDLGSASGAVQVSCTVKKQF